MKHPIYTVIVIILISITYCTDNPTNVEDVDKGVQEKVDANLNSLIKMENVLNIDIGGENTEFKFKIITVDSNDSPILEDRTVMWDYDSDGVFDTEWLQSDSTKMVFSELGKYNITAKVNLIAKK